MTKRWGKLKNDPVLMAAYRARRNAWIEKKRLEDPEWHEQKKSYLRSYYKTHKNDAIQRVKEWRHKNPGSRSGEHRTARYLISQADYLKLAAAQKGLCAICREIPVGNKAMGVLHVDHDHRNGRVRALLCHSCNKGLGHFKDNRKVMMRAVRYLKRHDL